MKSFSLISTVLFRLAPSAAKVPIRREATTRTWQYGWHGKLIAEAGPALKSEEVRETHKRIQTD